VVSVNDRDTIMLGGFISTTKSKNNSGVPYLKDIPLLGNLFRSSNETASRTELIVLLRPTVLPTPEAAAQTAGVERARLPGVRRAEKEIQQDDEKRLRAAEKELEAPKAGE
jgi:general secretion pathway protein D